jgi:hypothetical protein
MEKFNEAVKSVTSPGQVITVPHPMSGPGSPLAKERVWLVLRSINENGLYDFDVKWLGIIMGKLHGRPDGTEWRFS